MLPQREVTENRLSGSKMERSNRDYLSPFVWAIFKLQDGAWWSASWALQLSWVFPHLSGSPSPILRTVAWVSRWWLVDCAGNSDDSWSLTWEEQMAPSTQGCTDSRLGCCQACRGAMLNAHTEMCQLRICGTWLSDDNQIDNCGNVMSVFFQ